MISRKTTAYDVNIAVGLAKDEYQGEEGLAVNTLHNLSHGLPFQTILDNDENILCIVGVTPVWNGVVELNTIFTKDCYLNRISLARYLKKSFALFFASVDAHRVQAIARASFTEAQHFLLFLGFEYEAVLHKYGTDGTDYVMFRKVK